MEGHRTETGTWRWVGLEAKATTQQNLVHCVGCFWGDLVVIGGDRVVCPVGGESGSLCRVILG